MIQSIIFVNIFFVPVLTLYLCDKPNNMPIVSNIELFFHYCIAVSCNLVLTKILLAFPRSLFKVVLDMDSVKYTVAALFSACLLALFCRIIRRIGIEIKVSRIEEANQTSHEKEV